MNVLQKLIWFPGKQLSNKDKREAEEQAYAELFVSCLNRQFGGDWYIAIFQPHKQSDVTDVLIRNASGEEKKLQLTHGDPEFQKSRPKLLKGEAMTRWVQDTTFVSRMIGSSVSSKIEKYKERAVGTPLYYTVVPSIILKQ